MSNNLHFHITDNFKYSEFRCVDDTDVPIELIPNITIVALQLEVVRAYFNAPIMILSAYRTERHNKFVHGAKNSYHLTAKAVDFIVKGYRPKQVQEVLQSLMHNNKIMQGGLGKYHTFTHYDIRGHFATW